MGEYPGKSLLKALPIQPLTRRRGRGHEESPELWGRLPAEQRRVHLEVSSPAPGLVASVWISAINTADHYSASTSHQTASAVMMLHYRDHIPHILILIFPHFADVLDNKKTKNQKPKPKNQKQKPKTKTIYLMFNSYGF